MEPSTLPTTPSITNVIPSVVANLGSIFAAQLPTQPSTTSIFAPQPTTPTPTPTPILTPTPTPTTSVFASPTAIGNFKTPFFILLFFLFIFRFQFFFYGIIKFS